VVFLDDQPSAKRTVSHFLCLCTCECLFGRVLSTSRVSVCGPLGS
jgi:hypothetical protein